jgi:hypothetical protein
MNKKIIMIGIIVLLLCMPISLSYSISVPTIKNIKNYKVSSTGINNTTEVPEWAVGNFSGVWGLNVLGVPLEPAGWIEGYYSDAFFFRMQGVYGKNNETEPMCNISTWAFGPFLIGGVQDIATGNGTFVVGLGGVNETQHFYWRISAIIGPNFYIYGTITKFE